jgi:hypothetical protein
MINVIKEIDISENLKLLKIKNPKFKFYHNLKFTNAGRIIHDSPIVSEFVDRPKNKGSYLLFYTTQRYYHDILELIPKIIALRLQGEEFKVILCINPNLTNRIENGIAVGMDKKITEPLNEYRSLPYFKEFLDSEGIEFECMFLNDVDNFSCEYSYQFYYKKIGKINLFKDWGDVEQEVLEECNYEYNYVLHTLYDEPPAKLNNLDCLNVDGYYRASHSFFNPREIEYDHINILKEYYGTHQVITGKKIFISRRNFPDRRVSNELKIEEYFENKGFEILCAENYTIPEQLKIVQESEYIVGIAGAGLINTMLCTNETKILVLDLGMNYPIEPILEAYTKFGIYSRIVPIREDLEESLGSSIKDSLPL